MLGHSERRELFGETDKALALKVPAALAAGLVPILCVGETEEERERGDTERKLRHQVQEGLARVADRAAGRGRDRLRADLGDRHRQGRRRPSRRRRRSRSSARWSATARRSRPQRTRILYGGSVKPDNAAELLALPDIDGALVGGASLDAESLRRDRRRRGVMPVTTEPGARGRTRGRPRAGGAGCARRLGAGAGRARATPSRSPTTPVFDELWSSYPHTTLTASGRAVGLPEGQMGNSEVGPPEPRRGQLS